MDHPQGTSTLAENNTCPWLTVLDTNVVLDWLLWADPSTAALAQTASAGRLRWVWTERMRAELAHVLDHRLPHLAVTRREAVLQRADAQAVAWGGCEPTCMATMRCRDASDQMFIDLAAALAADARREVTLLSRDRALLALARRARNAGFVVSTPSALVRP